ncbi:hypothetical protein B0H13DRAFT_2272697, partial [Mycena leptocephala]
MDSPYDHYAPYQQNQETQWNSSQPAVEDYSQQSDMSLSPPEVDAEKQTAGGVTDGKENWQQWFPQRTTGLVAWFTFFSLASAALTLTALFGCYSTATSNLHITGMEPYTIYDACLVSLQLIA